MSKSYWDAIAPVWEEVSIYDGPQIFLRDFTRLPGPVGHLFAAHWCQSEICNGGLMQFFCNSTGVLGPEAVLGFEAIGMPKIAAVVKEAMSYFGSEYPRDRDLRCAALDEAEDDDDDLYTGPFGSLDRRFYELVDQENGGFGKAADQFALHYT